MKQVSYRDITNIPEGKIFWLDQYKEMEYAAKKIAESKQTNNLELQIIIGEYYEENKYRGKGELQQTIFKKIVELTVPREKPGKKYIEQELFI